MRKIKYILLIVFTFGMLGSCVDQETSYDANMDSPNVAGFSDIRLAFTKVADGTEQTFKVKVRLTGPTVMDLKEDVTLTFGADASSTAVEGTHFKITNPTVTLTAANNYLGFVEFTMLTAGIETPIAKAPVLVLKVTDAKGSDKVLNNGKTLAITLNYACFSNLAGTYSVVLKRTTAAGVVTTYGAYNEVISEIGVGTYRTEFVGHWIPTNGGGLGVGTPGFTFNDICKVVTVPEQNLLDYYSNIVIGTEPGAVNADKTITIKYQISFAAGASTYIATYTPAN